MVSYTPEDLAEVVAAKMDATSLDPLRLMPIKEAVDRVRRRYRVDASQADDLVSKAVRAGTLVMLRNAVSGHHLSQLKPLPDGIRFQWDVLDGSHEGREGLDAEFTLDRSGLIHGVWELPDGVEVAPDDSEWVTTPARFKQLVSAINGWAAGRTVEFHAQRLVESAAVDIVSGEEIDQIAGLLWLAGVRNRLAVEARTFEGRVHVSITLRGPEQISAVAGLLRKAGFPTDGNWRKFL